MLLLSRDAISLIGKSEIMGLVCYQCGALIVYSYEVRGQRGQVEASMALLIYLCLTQRGSSI